MAERHKTGVVHEPVMHDRVCRPGQLKSERRDAFIDLYMATGDEVMAYEMAGYNCTSQRSLSSAANRLLNDPYVRSEIERRTREEGHEHPLQRHGHADPALPAIASREERQRFWTETMRDSGQDMKFRLKASEYLARTQGDFIEMPKVIVVSDVRKTVQDLLGLGDDFIDVTPQPGGGDDDY